jgi:hypothetical protein
MFVIETAALGSDLGTPIFNRGRRATMMNSTAPAHTVPDNLQITRNTPLTTLWNCRCDACLRDGFNRIEISGC